MGLVQPARRRRSALPVHATTTTTDRNVDRLMSTPVADRGCGGGAILGDRRRRRDRLRTRAMQRSTSPNPKGGRTERTPAVDLLRVTRISGVLGYSTSRYSGAHIGYPRARRSLLHTTPRGTVARPRARGSPRQLWPGGPAPAPSDRSRRIRQPQLADGAPDRALCAHHLVSNEGVSVGLSAASVGRASHVARLTVAIRVYR